MRLEYIGEPDRVYPTLGIKPEVGEVYELPFGPEDGRWKIPGDDAPADEALESPEPAVNAETPTTAPETTESAPAETEHQE